VVTRCFGWQLNFDYHVTMLIVLWALGWAMIVLSALVWLPGLPGNDVRRGHDRRP
jgi:uncharacterized membrane protein